MAPPPARRRGLLEKRREDITRIDAMTVKVTRLYGRVLIVGAGEAAVDIPFPVVFSERPIFTFGGELDTNFRPTATLYPTISAVVVGWEQIDASDTSDGRFVGARVAVVTTGVDDQQLWLHYSFEAKAMRNPLNSAGSTDDTI